MFATYAIWLITEYNGRLLVTILKKIIVQQKSYPKSQQEKIQKGIKYEQNLNFCNKKINLDFRQCVQKQHNSWKKRLQIVEAHQNFFSFTDPSSYWENLLLLFWQLLYWCYYWWSYAKGNMEKLIWKEY